MTELLTYDALIKTYPDYGSILEKLAYKKIPETSFPERSCVISSEI